MWVKATSAVSVLILLAITQWAPTNLPRNHTWASGSYVAAIDAEGRLSVMLAGADDGLSVRTHSLERGERVWSTSSTELGTDGVVRRSWGAATETLRSVAAGMAQAWDFEQAPPGRGALTVRVQAWGGAAARSTSRGIRYGGLVYGAATWIDATGKRTPLTEQVAGDTITITVPANVLDDSAYPAVLDPVIGPENPVDDPVFEPQQDDQIRPAVAFDGTQYLVAWRDVGERAVTVARVGLNGVPLDPLGIKLPAKFHEAPDVLFDGTNFVVMWSYSAVLFMARVAPDGTVLDVPAREVWVGGGLASAFGPRIAYGAGHYFVAAHEAAQINAPSPLGYLFNSDFDLVAGPTWLTDVGGDSGHTDVAFDGQQFVAVWERYESFLPGTTATIGGVLVDPVTMSQTQLPALIADDTATRTYSRPALTPVTGGVLVAWTDERNANLDIYTRHIATNGTLSAEQLAVQSVDDDAVSALTGHGATALLTYREANQTNCAVCSQTVDSSGAPIGGLVDVGIIGDQLALASSPGAALMGYRANNDIFALPLNATGAPTAAPTLLSIQANGQNSPTISRAGDENLIAWFDRRTTPPELRAVRVDADGISIEPSAVIATPQFADPDAPVATASNGQQWLAAWPTNSGTDVIAIPPLASSLPTSTGNGFGTLELIHDGSTFLLLNEENIGVCRGVCTFYYDIYPTRLDDSGAQIEMMASLDPTARAVAPAAVGVGNAALVVWETVDDAAFEGDISAALIPHGELPGMPFVVTSALGKQSEPAVAFDGNQALVVWKDEQTGGSEIRGVRMLPDGTLVDGEPLIISSALESSNPQVAWTDDGHSFLVTWVGSAAAAPTEIYGAWVTVDGEVLDFPGVPLTTSEQPVLQQRLAAQGQGRVLLTYERRVDDLRASRILTRVVTSGELDGGACVIDDDCASRLCEDGACCDVSCGQCETCNGETPGICSPVTNADDDTCFGTVTCDAAGECNKAPGQPCDATDECASGFCIEGVCCDTACDGTCDSCIVSPGTCVTKDCGAYSCNEDKSCRSDCENSTECAAGFQCTSEHLCAAEQTSALIEQGCGCRIVGSPRRRPAWLLLAMLGLSLYRRRSRACRRAKSA